MHPDGSLAGPASHRESSFHARRPTGHESARAGTPEPGRERHGRAVHARGAACARRPARRGAGCAGPEPPAVVKLKVCMSGEAMVGKTFLIRRFVQDEYDDRYIATLGTKVSKKEIHLADPRTGGASEVRLMVWDVMGTRTLRDLLKEAYYHGAQGILAVADLTRAETLRELDAWSASIREVAGDIPVYVVVNKADLQTERRMTDAEIETFCRARGWPWSFTSAKSGDGVETAFRVLVERILASRS